MAELNKDDLISKEGLEVPLLLAGNFDKLAKSLLAVIENGKVLNKEFAGAKGVKELSKSTKKLSTNQTELEKVEKRLVVAQQKSNKEYVRKSAELKKVQSQTRDAIKTEGQLSRSYDAQSTRLKNLRKEYKDSVLLKGKDAKATQQLARRVSILDTRLKEVDASAGEFNREVGNYKNKMSEALKETEVFGVSIGGITGKLASLVNPVTAVVGAVTALGAAYLSTTRGTRDLQRASDRLDTSFKLLGNSVANAFGATESAGIVDRFTKSFLKEFLNTLVPGLGDVSQAIADEVNKIRENLREIDLRETRSQTRLKSLLDEAELQRQIRDEERNSITERYAANQKLAEVIKQRQDERLTFLNDEKKEVQNLIDILGQEPELLQRIAQLNFEIADIKEESRGFESEQLVNDLALTREFNEEELRIVKARIAGQLLLVEKNSRKELELKLKLVDLEEQLLLDSAGEFEERRNAIFQESLNKRTALFKDYQANIEQLQKVESVNPFETDFNADEFLQNTRDKLENDIDIRASLYQQDVDNFNKAEEEKRKLKEAAAFAAIDIGNSIFQAQANNINAELDLLRASTDAKLQNDQLTEEGRQLIQENAAKKEKKLRQEQAKNERRQAVFGILTNTALAIANILGQTGIFAPPFIAIAAATGAAQLLALPPIPQFWKGTESSPEGLAVVNEKGGELLEKDGKYSMVESKGSALTYLEQGTKVHTAKETQQLLAKGAVTSLSVSDRQPTNTLDSKMYNELRKMNKSLNSVKSYNSYLDGKLIGSNIRKRNATINKVKSMNRY